MMLSSERMVPRFLGFISRLRYRHMLAVSAVSCKVDRFRTS